MKVTIPPKCLSCFYFVNNNLWLVIDMFACHCLNQLSVLYLVSNNEFKNNLVRQLIHSESIPDLINKIQGFVLNDQDLSNGSPIPCLSSRVKYKTGNYVNVILSRMNNTLQDQNLGNFIAELPCCISDRELEVLQLLSKGDSSKIIAEKLHVCESTIVTHRRNLLSKFEAKNSAELIRIAFQNNLIS